METDFKTIQILGKIFGVTLVVVSEEQDGTCRRMIFNGGIDDNLPCFHYFSRLNARNMKKIVALFTFRDDFLDGYQGDRVELKIKRSIILDENAEDTKIQKSKSIKNQSQDYFIALNKIQNTILTSYLTKITEGLPPSIEENLTEDLLILKSLKSQQDINPSDFNSNNFEVLNFSFESFNTTCHKCNISITSSKNEIFSREGCFFHFECVLSMYKEWMETSIDYSLQIEDYELKCPRCKNRSISILSFLKHEENKENLRIFLLIFTKKMTCSNCFVTFYINPETFNLNNPICFNCAIKNSPETIVICGECKNQTLAVNLRYRATTKEFKCKICWINQAAIFINNKKLEDFNDVLGNILGNGSIIDCENCGSKYFKNAGNFFCEYGCYPILMSTCFNCVGEGKCEACAGNIKQDFFKKWE
jgi:Zn finger protein HypA/HybF involved in hydrogenase expression